jgi:hypothetical protein
MEYYLYVSESKVNMLFPQIPQETKGKLGAEVEASLGVLKAKVKSEKESQPKENLIARLQAVVDYLKRSEQPGSVDKPKSWIEDTQSARVIYLAENNQVVFFVGTSPGGSRFALGGSAANLLSHQKPETVQIGWSFLPDLIQSLQIMVSVSDEKSSQESVERFLRGTAASNEFEWMDLLKAVQGASSGTTMRIKFIAKKLLSGAHVQDGRFGVLATPLYVAMAQ